MFFVGLRADEKREVFREPAHVADEKHDVFRGSISGRRKTLFYLKDCRTVAVEVFLII